MANIKSAKKRARQAIKHHQHNMGANSKIRTMVKKVRAAIAQGDKKAATDAFKMTVPVLDSSQNKGLVHANKVARLKSRLNAQIKTLA